MHIIPAIDIIDGKCVRLEQGHYDKKTVYHEDPVEVAKMFADHGIRYLHLVDLDGAKASRVINHDVLGRITHSVDLIVDWGGGIKSEEDLRIVFEHGAQQATVGSIAAEQPGLFHTWLDLFGSDRLILGADLKGGKVATRGWLETTEMGWEEFFTQHLEQGVRTVISTDVARDGMLEGPALSLYRDMLLKFPELNLIASGGISSLEDLYLLQELGCFGAIVGKAIYEEKISLTQIQAFL